MDFIAAAIVGSSSKSHREINTYNVLNHHSDDGVSLDTVVDWIESAGYPVQRLPDHAEWLKRFEAKLSTLTEHQRQHSSLSVLGGMASPASGSSAPGRQRTFHCRGEGAELRSGSTSHYRGLHSQILGRHAQFGSDWRAEIGLARGGRMIATVRNAGSPQWRH